VGGVALTGIDVGGVYVTYTTQSTAASSDGGSTDPGPPSFLPNVSSFQSQNGVPRSTLVVSNTITVSNFGAPITVTITNGEYSVGCNQTFTTGPGPIPDGSQLCVRHTSSSDYATTTKTNITLDSGKAQFSTVFTATTVGGSTTVTTSSSSGGGGALDFSLLSALGLMGILSRWLGARGASRSRRE
jgi:hypothetical protein